MLLAYKTASSSAICLEHGDARIDTRDIMDIKQLKDGLETFLKAELNKPIRVRKAVTALIHPFLVPNLTLNQETTQHRKREIMARRGAPLLQYQKGRDHRPSRANGGPGTADQAAGPVPASNPEACSIWKARASWRYAP
jgi:hypothetical protein